MHHDEAGTVTYRGQLGGRGGEIFSLKIGPVHEGKSWVAVYVGTNGCLGDIAGQATVRGNVLHLTKNDSGDDCRLTIHRSATGATIAENNCASGHGPSCSFDTRGQTLRRVEPLETQEDSKPETRHTGVAPEKMGEPLDIVQRMYRDVLSNSRDLIESPTNNSRYFVPALARRITDCFKTFDCLLEIEFSGNGGPDTDQMRRTLSLEQLSNDGAHAVIQAKFFAYGKEETRRFEFTKAGNAWKISDVVYPDGHRLSNLKR